MNPKRFALVLLRVLQFGLPLALLTPFLYVSSTTFPFVTSKVWVFCGLIEILLPVWLGVLIFFPERRPDRWPLVIALLAYAGVLISASIFGVDFHRSFWANHERMTGVYALLHYIIFAFFVSSAYRTRKEWNIVFIFSICASIAMCFVALWERTHEGFLASHAHGRVWATLGNYIYLANYLLFNAYFALMIIHRRELRMWLRTLLWAVLFLQFLVIIYTETRGSVVAIAAALLIILFLEAVGERRIRVYAVSAMIGVVFIGAFLFFNRAQPWVLHLPMVGKLANTNFNDGGVRTRFIAWEIAVQAFKERPLLGWGPENFYYAFNAHYRPESYRYSPYETWFDRPHNNVLEVLFATGGVGMLSYIGLFVTAWIVVLRLVKRGDMTRWEGALTVGMLVAYVLQNITVFDSHTSFLYFYLVLGFIGGIRSELASLQENITPAHVRMAGVVMGATGVVCLVLVFYTNLQPFQANRLGLYGTSYLRLAGNVPEGVRFYRQALETPTPHLRDLRVDAARDVTDVLATGKLSAKDAAPYYDWAIDLLLKNRKERPNDVYDGIALAQVYMTYAFIRPEMADRALEVLNEIRPLSPKRQQILFTMARVNMMKGRYADAESVLLETATDEERIPELHWLLAMAYWAQQKSAEAQTAAVRAEDLHYRWGTDSELFMAYQIHRTAQDVERALVVARTLAVNWPQSARYHLILAQSLLADNQIEESRVALEQAEKINDPEWRQDIIEFEKLLNQAVRVAERK